MDLGGIGGVNMIKISYLKVLINKILFKNVSIVKRIYPLEANSYPLVAFIYSVKMIRIWGICSIAS